jgi:hypothetical protein
MFLTSPYIDQAISLKTPAARVNERNRDFFIKHHKRVPSLGIVSRPFGVQLLLTCPDILMTRMHAPRWGRAQISVRPRSNLSTRQREGSG